jgi:hypothetical protein
MAAQDAIGVLELAPPFLERVLTFLPVRKSTLITRSWH